MWLYSSILLLSATNLVSSFVVLPYIQIDYAHLIRVAHCKAKCSEKYGYPKTREQLDGSIDEYFFVSTEEYTKCENGCLQFQHRRDMKRSNLTGETLQGAKFWIESSAHSGKVGSSPVSSAELLCQMPSATVDLDDSFEGLLGLTKVRPSGPVQYVVQWKQRTYALGYYDESQWITASVESDSIIKVDGMIPGVQYKFLVTVVGPAGKLGDTIQSEWTEISNTLIVKTPSAPLIVKNGFNSEQGVIAHLHFPRTAYDSCNLRVQVKNATNSIVTDVRVDPTFSILLSHLEFDSSYAVTLSALSSDQITATSPISVRFNSFQCRQVYGKGSLHCAPEPVSNIRVAVRPNSTALITWTASAEPENILTYAITYQAFLGTCNKDPTTVYLAAPSTSYEMPLPSNKHCEFMFRITNYDAIGREAFAETRIAVIKEHLVNASMKIPLIALGVSSFLLVLAVFCFAICRCCCTKCPAKVAENKTKLTDYA
uniref:Fibronectin type-III domain-containing protein n=1 Tax=Caenorhabditis japonica TaxID=281687 RepID=A0A8R1I7D4_CAEJA